MEHCKLHINNNNKQIYKAPCMPTEGCRGAGEVSVRCPDNVWWQQLNKNVLRCLLKLCSESHNTTSVGRYSSFAR